MKNQVIVKKGPRSLAAQAVAYDVIEAISKGKIPNKTKIALKHGYSLNSAKTAVAVNRLGYKEVMEPFVAKLEAKRERMIKNLTDKKLTKAGVRDLVDGIDKFTKNIELLSGRPTARDGIEIPPGKYAILINREAERTAGSIEAGGKE